jgi:hypothetical protein
MRKILLVTIILLLLGACVYRSDNGNSTASSNLVSTTIFDHESFSVAQSVLHEKLFSTAPYPSELPVEYIIFSSPNPYFNGMRSRYLTWVRTNADEDILMHLNVAKVAVRKDGVVYEMKLDGEIYSSSYDGRLSLGYFLVQNDRILRFDYNDETLETLVKGKELPENFVVVCKNDGDEEVVEGWRSEFPLGYMEIYRWEKNKGLKEFYSYYGEGQYGLRILLDQLSP